MLNILPETADPIVLPIVPKTVLAEVIIVQQGTFFLSVPCLPVL